MSTGQVNVFWKSSLFHSLPYAIRRVEAEEFVGILGSSNSRFYPLESAWGI